MSRQHVGDSYPENHAENSCHGVGNVITMQSRTLNIVIAGMLAIGVVGFPTARCYADQQQVLDSGAPRRSMDVDSELEHVTKELGLTEVQREQIRPLLVEHQRKEQALHQDTSLSPDDLRVKGSRYQRRHAQGD